MMRLSNLTLRNALIAAHDALATALAVLASFYLRFEGDAFFDRLPLLLRILPYFVAFSVVVCYAFNLTTTKWRFISLPDALNILRVATVLTLGLVVLDYVFVAPNVHGTPVAPNVQGAFFLGKITIVLYWFLEVFFLSASRFAYRYFRYTRVRHHAQAEVAVEDLLLRPSENIDYARLEAFVKNKSVIVTGGGGSIGAEICERVVTFGAGRLLVIENSEPALYAVTEALAVHQTSAVIEGRIADIRDRERMLRQMNEFKPDIVFHAAALKHGPILERDLSEGDTTNIFG